MLRVLAHPVFQRLFAAQVVALSGTGLLTIALGLLAYDLAGASAGAVLGGVLTIKMLAYVGLSPVLQAAMATWDRRRVLIGADLIRAAVACALPFVDAVWQIYVLVFLLQAASAAFTPAFQATIPDVLSNEDDYTTALSLSRLAYDLENLLSPALAALLLSFIGFHWLFAGTVIGFLASTLLIVTTLIPTPRPTKDRPFRERLTLGIKLYLATPRLRGLLALTGTAAAVSAFVLVNTVLIVRDTYGLDEASVALAMAAFGAGSMLAAFALPRLLERRSARPLMLSSALGLALTGALVAFLLGRDAGLGWPIFLLYWGLLGLFYSATVTPSGRLLRKSGEADTRPALFAAHFALSHACWLVAYPLAGFLGKAVGLPATLAALSAIGLAAVGIGWRVWTPSETKTPPHSHPDLPPDHPHLRAHPGLPHSHGVMDDHLHRQIKSDGQ